MLFHSNKHSSILFSTTRSNKLKRYKGWFHLRVDPRFVNEKRQWESQRSALPAGCLESSDHLIVQAATAASGDESRQRREWDLAARSVGQLEDIGLLLMRPQSFVYFCVIAALNPSFFSEAISSGASPPPPGTQIWLRRNRTCVFLRETRLCEPRRRHFERERSPVGGRDAPHLPPV